MIIGAIIWTEIWGIPGLTFGLTSLWKNTFMPNPTSFVFSPFVTMDSFTEIRKPGYLPGSADTDWVVAYYVYRLVMRMLKNRK